MELFEPLYKNTVTLFNRCIMEDETCIWIPTVLKRVHLVTDRAKIVSTYGENATDNAMLNVRYFGGRDNPIVEGKRYLTQKEFRKLYLTEAEEAITFAIGDDFDFFIDGEWKELQDLSGSIVDDYYVSFGGFYNYMNINYDNVFAITGVSKYDLLPHFSITAR